MKLTTAFDPEALRVWVHGLDFGTFFDTSGSVFPISMKNTPERVHDTEKSALVGLGDAKGNTPNSQ